MKKVLVVTIFTVPNYGSVLQTFATQKLISDLGYECWILNYDHNKGDWAKKHGVKGVTLKTRLCVALGITKFHRKVKLLRKFTQKNFQLTLPYKSLEQIKKNEGDSYDVYVSGSDQIWNTRFTNCDPMFLLQFACRQKKRISIASSFASKTIDPLYLETFRNELSLYHALSVREKNGVDILHSLGCVNGRIMLDPTLLLSREQWNGLRNVTHKKGKYILLYLLRYAFDPCPYIYKVLEYYRSKLDCNIIALEGYNRYDKEMKDLNIIDATDSSIPDFLDLFANASLVVTSSFHGTAFALNYGIPLLSITPATGDDRQRSLLAQLNLEECCLKVNEPISNANPFYDVHNEQGRLQAMRADALQWIKNVIEV